MSYLLYKECSQLNLGKKNIHEVKDLNGSDLSFSPIYHTKNPSDELYEIISSVQIIITDDLPVYYSTKFYSGYFVIINGRGYPMDIFEKYKNSDFYHEDYLYEKFNISKFGAEQVNTILKNFVKGEVKK